MAICAGPYPFSTYPVAAGSFGPRTSVSARSHSIASQSVRHARQTLHCPHLGQGLAGTLAHVVLASRMPRATARPTALGKLT